MRSFSIKRFYFTYQAMLLASLGLALEYYDFVIYGLLAHYLSETFFPQSNTMVTLAKTLGIFAVGYLVRPFGGVILGILGDRFGRKFCFLLSMLLMASCTVLIGLIPSYNSIGIAAPISLLLLRMMQGFAYGAEFPAAITFINEHVTQRHGWHSGLMLAAMSSSTFFASGIIYVLIHLLSNEAMALYGWRIPFLIGGLLAIIGYYARRTLLETPVFMHDNTRHQQWKAPVKELIHMHKKSLLAATLIVLTPASLILFMLASPGFIHTFFQYPNQQIYLYYTLSTALCAMMLPIAGFISDHFERKRFYKLACLLFIISIFPLFYGLQTQSKFALFIFVCMNEILIAMFAVCYVPLLVQLFPTRVRLTGIGLSYNIAMTIGGFVPSLLMFLSYWATHPVFVLAGIFIILGISSLMALYSIHRYQLSSHLFNLNEKIDKSSSL